ncbi:hypothetical protein HN709_00995, partial [Candidatus Peregrinibacteria bacterium]|nr:hypothetical protein [Candidatus Peregrinibacteria bacterium]
AATAAAAATAAKVPATATAGGTSFALLPKADKDAITEARTKINGEVSKTTHTDIKQGDVSANMKALGDKGVKADEVKGIIGDDAWGKLIASFPDLSDPAKLEKVLKGEALPAAKKTTP